MKKRIMALLIAFTLVLFCLPISVFAEGASDETADSAGHMKRQTI